MAKQSINQEDKRVQKTKSALKAALTDLLNQKSLEEVTICELCEQAKINRKTFYAHYSSLDELISECQNDSATNLVVLLTDFLQENEGHLSPNYLFACLNVICRQSIPFFGTAEGVKKNYTLFQKYTATLSQVIIDHMRIFARDNHIDETSLDFIASFIAGGIVNTYYEWLLNPHDLTIEEIAELTSTMITTGLTTI